MPVDHTRAQALLEKLSELRPEKLAEVEDFVDFLRQRQEPENFAALSLVLSEPVLRGIWDNPQDEAYDQL